MYLNVPINIGDMPNLMRDMSLTPSKRVIKAKVSLLSLRKWCMFSPLSRLFDPMSCMLPLLRRGNLYILFNRWPCAWEGKLESIFWKVFILNRLISSPSNVMLLYTIIPISMFIIQKYIIIYLRLVTLNL